MNKDKQIIGLNSAKICFYLPTAPTLAPDWHHNGPEAVHKLIKANGNHWRKILTIMAKITVTDMNWKNYRDEQLLKHHEALWIDSDSLNPNASLHIICGQKSAQKLNLSSNLFKPISANTNYVSKHTNQAIYICPYLDYRQFPNREINMLRVALNLPPLN